MALGIGREIRRGEEGRRDRIAQSHLNHFTIRNTSFTKFFLLLNLKNYVIRMCWTIVIFTLFQVLKGVIIILDPFWSNINI